MSTSPRVTSIVWVFAALAGMGCHHQQPLEVERRVPVDVVGDCVLLRQSIGECREEFAPVLIERRALHEPGLKERLQEPEVRRAAREQALQDLAREAELLPEERRRRCRVAAAELPPPRPDDVMKLHQCLSLQCAERASCLRPLLLSSK